MTAAPLPALARTYGDAVADAVRREYPNALRHVLTSAEDAGLTPRRLHPAFYGCFDWHSAVEMHWALVRLLRLAPEETPDTVVAVLDEHLTAENLLVERAYFDGGTVWERPYGWGWVLSLGAELRSWADAGDVRARGWADAVAPLAERLAELMTGWLGRATYPTREGAHMNSAFALVRSWDWAAGHDPALLAAIRDAALRWFAADVDYPVAWEPGGSDFLSGALTEAELMHRVLPADEFRRWIAAFLPDPSPLWTPAVVSDAADGYITHLHGLNLYRAAALRTLADVLGPGAQAARQAHLDASLPAVVGGDWMAEHWLAAYAVLALG